jgi:heme oxygenase
MLIEKVRAATYAHHQTLDHSMIPYIEAVQSTNDYAALLLLFYGFFKPVYDSIDLFIDRAYLPDYQSRRKPEWILNDLEELEVNSTIKLCKHISVINNNAAAFGALYVLEGSTLGGMVIRKIISNKLHIDKGLTFFSGYGKQTRERWNVFIHSLNNIHCNNIADDKVIQTAAATFTFFKEWLQQYCQPQQLLKQKTPAEY